MKNLDHSFDPLFFKINAFSVVDSKPDEIACNEDFRVVLSSNLDGHEFLYSSATDCIIPDLFDEEAEDMNAFVGLKTTMEIDDEIRQSKFNKYVFY